MGEHLPEERRDASLPASLTIIGSLSEGKQLAKPLMLQISYDDGEVVVSEPRFYIHASGSNVSDAVAAFRRIFGEYLDVLAAKEEDLDGYMLRQWQYLRSSIVSA